MNARRRRAVFLDRDGVLNALVQRGAVRSSPRRLEEFRLVPGAAEVVRRLHESGLLVFVVTNQPDIARGLISRADLAQMTAQLRSALAVDEVAVCPHDDRDGCGCRKPAPGLLVDLGERWNVDLQGSFMVGDTWRDVEAGQAAGCRTMLVGSEGGAACAPDFMVADLREASRLIRSSLQDPGTMLPNAREGPAASGTTKGDRMAGSFSRGFLSGVAAIAAQLDVEVIDHMATVIHEIRGRGGRLFFVGVGGGAAHASHAAADFRMLAGIECYAPTDSAAELTARINDDGWDGAISAWLTSSRVGPRDGVFVFSVGGGSQAQRISTNIVNAVDLARSVGATVLGIVGRDGGYTARNGDAVLVVPTVDPGLVTAHTEAFQAVVWHLLVSHPAVAVRKGKWESVGEGR